MVPKRGLEWNEHTARQRNRFGPICISTADGGFLQQASEVEVMSPKNAACSQQAQSAGWLH